MPLIINADDFGLCASVNKAIVDVFLAGNLSSTTMMVNMPGWDDALRLAKEHPKLGIGLHFNITEGKALAGISSLTTSEGEFYTRSELIRRMFKRQINREDILKEFRAQYKKFHAALGKPTHMDSHQHLHMNPFVFSALAAEWKSLDLPVRLVAPHFSVKLFFTRPPKALAQGLLSMLSKWYRLRYGIRANDRMVSVHDAGPDLAIQKDTYSRLVRNLREHECIELMVHPYILTQELFDLYPNDLSERQVFFSMAAAEYKVLSMPATFDERLRTQLIRYDEF